MTWRQRKDIALAPIETLSVDDRAAGAIHHVVNRAAGMAMRLGVFPRPQQLNHARHRRQYRPTGLRMPIFEQHSVVQASFMCLPCGIISILSPGGGVNSTSSLRSTTQVID